LVEVVIDPLQYRGIINDTHSLTSNDICTSNDEKNLVRGWAGMGIKQVGMKLIGV